MCQQRETEYVKVCDIAKTDFKTEKYCSTDHLPRIRKQNLTMNSSLTVYRVCKNLPIDHPIRHVENVSGQAPCWLLIWMKYGLSSHSEAHKHHQHDHHKVHHINHLKGIKQREHASSVCSLSFCVCACHL